jgi:Flp pilus assembly protein TadG
MVARALTDRLIGELKRFRSDRSGNIAILFTLGLVPIVGGVGAAVDYSHANSVKVAMQAAVDSTALMLSKEVANLSTADIEKKADSYFKAMLNRPEAKNVSVTPTYSAAKKTLKLASSGTVKTDFLGIIGIKKIKVHATSTVAWGGNKLEVALVLDNTGSMSTSGKMTALLDATDKFLSVMQKAAPQPGDVKIAIVPFDYQVNVGVANADKSWIDWSLLSKNGAYGGPSGHRDDDDDTRDDDNNDKAAVSAWNGCVIDRAQPNDVLDTAPTANSATWYPAVNCNLAPMQPLTSDFNLLRDMAKKMKAVGKTNLTIGLAWGWHALTPSAPLTQASLPAKNIGKYLIFMTDGLNTQNRWSTSAKAIDDRTRQICTAIKKSGVQIYTIRMLEGNASLLRDCASHSSFYFDVTQASQLTEVFTKIAGELSKLRISK